MLKSKLFVAASLAVTSLGALADGPNEIPSWFSEPQSTLTRAQVKAELEQARARGELMHGDGGAPFVAAPSTRTRKQVMAELREAQRLGLTGSAEVPVSTPEQEALIAKAGAEAAEQYASAGERKL
jgi:hypothetical protein